MLPLIDMNFNFELLFPVTHFHLIHSFLQIQLKFCNNKLLHAFNNVKDLSFNTSIKLKCIPIETFGVSYAVRHRLCTVMYIHGRAEYKQK